MKDHLRSALVGLLLAAALPAIYVRGEIEEVPLERLMVNAEAQLEDAPDAAAALHTLARIHAMAYAWKLGTEDGVATAARNDGALLPYFGYEPPWVPWTRERQRAEEPANGGSPTGTAEDAQAHLERSIELYRRAVEQAPDDTTMRLGLAWTLLESGERDEARDLLREVVTEAAPRELERGGHLGPLLAVEAIDYLLPLLDSEDDAAERAELEELRGRLEAMPRAITPIAIALRSGMTPDQMLDATRPVFFDLDGSGLERPWPWLGEDAAWLVWDPDGDGRVTSAIQLFGSRSFGLVLDNGYRALELLDDDRDGELRGSELDGIALWRDANRDGESDPDEVAAVAALGVVAIGCRATASSNGMLGAPGSVRRRDGTRLDSWDLVVESATVPTPTGSEPRPAAGRTTTRR